MAIKVLRENTSPKANKEILDVSPFALSLGNCEESPTVALGCFFFIGVHLRWTQTSSLNLSILGSLDVAGEGWVRVSGKGGYSGWG